MKNGKEIDREEEEKEEVNELDEEKNVNKKRKEDGSRKCRCGRK